MPVSLPIENVPDSIVTRLKQRAARHHRSLEKDFLAILEEALGAPQSLSPDDVLARVRDLGLSTPREAAAMLREDRDGRQDEHR